MPNQALGPGSRHRKNPLRDTERLSGDPCAPGWWVPDRPQQKRAGASSYQGPVAGLRAQATALSRRPPVPGHGTGSQEGQGSDMQAGAGAQRRQETESLGAPSPAGRPGCCSHKGDRGVQERLEWGPPVSGKGAVRPTDCPWAPLLLTLVRNRS